MSKYYNPVRRSVFNPEGAEPFKLSRSKIDLFLECPQCFYLDRRAGTGRPPGFPFSLNAAVDALLKKEFDMHRASATAHPLMEKFGIAAIPFQHEKLEYWRNALRGGVEYLHEPTNLLVTGAIDDLWVNDKGELIIVEYKATAKNGEINLDADWQESYKRQMEIYQWLLRQNGFKVSSTGYFVYVNGRADKDTFDGKLEFDITIIPYTGNDNWVEGSLNKIKECLVANKAPEANPDCDYCRYREAIINYNKNFI